MRCFFAALFVSAVVVLSMAHAPAAASARETSATNRNASAISAQTRRRPRVRIYREYDERGVYPSYFPGPYAVRDCTATYVEEFRPSGTVIVPRMNCFWRQP